MKVYVTTPEGKKVELKDGKETQLKLVVNNGIKVN